MKSFYLSILFVFLLLSGCSSSNSSSSNQVGHLMDGPVEGVSYACNSLSGVTDQNGTFEYNGGCTITFSIGGVTIGEILASDINTTDKKVYISEMLGFDRDNISDPKLIQVLQLLQTLDEDDNATNGIDIPTSASTDLNETLDLTTGTLTPTQIAQIESALGEPLVDADTALEHYLTTLNTDLGLTFETPTLSSFTDTLAENSTTGTTVGSITITNAGDSNITAITLSGTGAADFAVATSGAITVVNAPDFETQPSYSLTAVATNASGDSASVGVTITIANVPEQAPMLAAYSATIAENVTVGTEVGTITISDDGDTAITAIGLNGTGAADFTVATNGTITVVNAPDFEAQSGYSLTAIATNSFGDSPSVAIDINISNIAEIVPTISPLITAVTENTTAGSTVDTITIDSTGDSAITAITLSGTGAADFTVATNGTITVVNAPDYETQPSYSLTAVATNGAGDSTSVPVTIAVTGVVDTVPTLSAFITAVDENSTVSTVVGTIAVDAGDSSVTAINLTGTGASDFAVATDGTITVASALDFETQPSYSLSAVATNATGDSDPVSVTIALTDIPDVVPTLLDFYDTIAENTAVDAVVGTITVNAGDSDITDINLSGTGAADFTVATDGTITVVNEPDFEAQADYNLTAVATNAAGNSASVDVNIAISNVADVVPTLQPFTITIAEDTAVSTLIGDINISDSGDSNITAITLGGTGGSDFNAAYDGNITVASTLDYGTRATYYLTATATSLAGVSSSVPVTIMLDTKLIADVPAWQDYLGTSVAVDGDYVVVGAEGNASKAGSAFIYKNDGAGNYSQVAEVNASDASVDDNFGISVAIAGNYVVVGASYADPAATSAAGAAYVFVNDGADNFTEADILTASDAAVDDHFSFSVAMSGEYVVIGADNKTGGGAAYVFKKDVGLDTFSQIDKLTASDGGALDHFGWSVGIDGLYVVVGAPYHNPLGVSEAGAAYVYLNSADSYSEIDKLTASDGEVDDRLGWSVAISGDYAVAGAQDEDPAGVTDAGSAYIFKNDGANDYNEIAILNASDAVDSDNFGNAVSISGNYVLVGAYLKDPITDIPGQRGAAYLFLNDGADSYTEVTKVEGHDTTAGDKFGSSVAISGTSAVVGAEADNHSALAQPGSTYLFNFAP